MIPDRLRQFREANATPGEADFALAREVLAAPLYPLFTAQDPRDVVHSAGTARWLMARGHDDPDLLAAALLHDIGKGRQRRCDRTGYVLARAAGLGQRLGAADSTLAWRRAFARSSSHSITSAERLALAGASERAVYLVGRHHEAAGTDRMLALLQAADAAN